ncbi:MAG: VWA domain-containing protein [bacterium]|nr:VWA domain-containing protein [bacterium]
MRSVTFAMGVLAALFICSDAKTQTPTSSDEGMVVTTATVVTKGGDVIVSPLLEKENFRVFDCKNAKKRKDCVEQEIVFFSSPKEQEPIITVLTLDYSRTAFLVSCLGENDPYACGYYGSKGAIEEGPIAFLQNLKPQDWVAFVTYDMKPEVAVEFTKNKDEVRNALAGLFTMPPVFSDSNLFDTLFYVLDHIENGENLEAQKKRATIILVSTGIDTMSKKTFDQMQKRLRDTPVAIYAVRIGKSYENRSGANLLQAESQLKEITNLTGGKTYSPSFSGEFRGIFGDISAMLRSQYSIGWVPKNVKADGKFHEILIEVTGDFLDNATQKPLEIKVRHRKGYIAPDNR